MERNASDAVTTSSASSAEHHVSSASNPALNIVQDAKARLPAGNEGLFAQLTTNPFFTAVRSIFLLENETLLSPSRDLD